MPGHTLVAAHIPGQPMATSPKPPQTLHRSLCERQLEHQRGPPGRPPEPPRICTEPGTLRPGGPRADVHSIPNILPLAPQGHCQLGNINDLQLLNHKLASSLGLRSASKLGMIPSMLQCIKQPLDPVMDPIPSSQLNSILQESPIEARSPHQRVPKACLTRQESGEMS